MRRFLKLEGKQVNVDLSKIHKGKLGEILEAC